MNTIPQAIYFDLDGTLADLYAVPEWLPKLKAEDTTPYEMATPMIDPETFISACEQLQSLGVIIGVISWGAIGCSNAYTRRTRKAKIDWCKRHYPACFTEYHVVKYGRRPKWQTANVRDSILFDDDPHNCEQWHNGQAVNVTCAEDILSTLQTLINEMTIQGGYNE